jgi:uncharacterized protein
MSMKHFLLAGALAALGCQKEETLTPPAEPIEPVEEPAPPPCPDRESCWVKAQRLYLGVAGEQKDPKAAALHFDYACALRSADACNQLAAMYANGNGVEKNSARAASLYQRACNSGQAMACYNLAAFYEAGRGVPRDPDRAKMLYDLGCEQGFKQACERNKRKGAPQVPAAQLTKKCDGGDPKACTLLGTYHGMGKGAPKDLERAATLYQKGCDGGDMLGCYNLSAAYRVGNGVKVDPLKGDELLKKACDGGLEVACDAQKPFWQRDF